MVSSAAALLGPYAFLRQGAGGRSPPSQEFGGRAGQPASQPAGSSFSFVSFCMHPVLFQQQLHEDPVVCVGGVWAFPPSLPLLTLSGAHLRQLAICACLVGLVVVLLPCGWVTVCLCLLAASVGLSAHSVACPARPACVWSGSCLCVTQRGAIPSADMATVAARPPFCQSAGVSWCACVVGCFCSAELSVKCSCPPLLSPLLVDPPCPDSVQYVRGFSCG